MKKFILPGLFLALLAFPGCEKTPPEPEPDPDPQEEVKSVTITLTAEQVGTKTVLGEAEGTGYPIFWEASDEIWVRSAKENTGALGSRFKTSASGLMNGGRAAEFTGVTLDKGPYVAVYPWDLVSDKSTNEKVIVSVPQEQGYVSNSFGKGANISAAAWSSGTRATFTSIAGVMRLSLKGFSSVRRIEVADNDPSVALWGNCEIVPGTDAITSVKWVNDAEGKNKIIVNCDSSIPLALDKASDFYVVAPAGAFAKGFTCTLFDSSGAEISRIVKNEACTVTSNSIIPVLGEQVAFAKGTGTESDPFIIATPEDLALMGTLCAGSFADSFTGKCYKQTADINMQNVSMPCIGNTSAKPFTGTYDGGGFTIKNLSPTPAASKAAGMFGYASGAKISNVKIDGYTNNGTNGEQGVIAGNAKNSTFSNISVNAQVQFVLCACGGIVGLMEGGKISDCSVQGFIHDEKSGDFQGITVVSAVGGIVGCASKADISGCTVKGNVTAGGEQLGGIAGQLSECNVDKCKILEGSTVTGDNYYVGGIAGELLKGGKITDCEVQAHVICWYPGAAGIVAWLQSGDISGCVVGSNALVRTGQDKAGGIVAYIYHKDNPQTVNISDCAVYCDVAAAYSVGGIVGECNPTHDSSKINIWNCSYAGGEIINAGYAKGLWTMIGGLVAWARMGSTTATLNVVNCFSCPSAMRCDFPQGTEVDLGGFIGEQGGSNGTVLVQGCYNTVAPGNMIINGKQIIPAEYFQYAALVGNPTKINLSDVFYLRGFAPLGKSNSGESVRVTEMTNRQMTDGTLLKALNDFQASYTGSLKLKKWTASANGLPILEGLAANPSTVKQKPLRVSLIGDSLSTFDGYAPHGYQASRAPNGYRCHYPTSDGNVTSATQTYWYMLTYDYLKNAVWDTNLAFSGTATTRCTNTSYSDKYWYGQDFCARYIENGGMGSPDIVLINGGANDWAHGIYNLLGDQKLVRYPSSTPHRPGDAAMNAAYAVADACKTLEEAQKLPDGTFIEAYLKLVRMITLQYPHVKIVMIIHDTLTPDVEESLLHIADHYDNCRAVDLYAVNGFNDLGWNFEYLSKGYQPNMPKHDFDWSSIVKTGDLRQNCSDHYSAQAMKFIAEKIYKELGSWLESSATYNESGNGSIKDYGNINGQW